MRKDPGENALVRRAYLASTSLTKRGPVTETVCLGVDGNDILEKKSRE